jgi:hypothetical protein
MSLITTPSSDFNIKESDVRRVISILSVIFTLGTITVPLRFIVRRKLKTGSFLDDWLILGASVRCSRNVYLVVMLIAFADIGCCAGVGIC